MTVITFASPPVVETICGVFFAPPRERAAVFPSLVWANCFSSEFPEIDERPALEAPSDDSGAGKQIRWTMSQRPEIPRLWARSRNDRQVVQCQANAFHANWLRPGGAVSEYIRYDQRKTAFLDYLRRIEDFAQHQKFFEGMEVRALISTYVNHIPCQSGETVAQTLKKTLRCCSADWSDGWLPVPELATFRAEVPIPDQQGVLSISAIPARDQLQGTPMIRLELHARRVLGEKTPLADCTDWFDIAHEWIVRGFVSVTTEAMQQEWRQAT